MSKYNYSLIGAILAIIFFIIGFIGPWYSISGEFLGLKSQIDIGLIETSISSGTDSNSIIAAIDRTEVDNTMYIAIITIILAIITLIGILATSFGVGKTVIMQKIGEIIGFLTFILAIITVIYYIANIPDTSDLDAIGLSTGLGWGFGLFLLGGILLFITNIWSRITRQEQ
jgi:hypothetical protein